MASKRILKDSQKDTPSDSSAVLEEQLKSSGFAPFPSKAKPGPFDVAEESADESDNVEQLLAQKVGKLQEELEELRKASPRSIWLRDLECLDMDQEDQGKGHGQFGGTTKGPKTV